MIRKKLSTWAAEQGVQYRTAMMWPDASVMCVWEYNQYSSVGNALVFDNVIYDRMKRSGDARAAEAAKEL